jgi:Holliday junction resolvase RusA-like endonuclease
MLVKLSLPPAELWPNARPHRMAKARATKAYRHEAAIEAKRAMGRSRPPRWTAATIQAEFYFPTVRRRDPDNCLAALKAAFDGLRDAGVIADDNQLTHRPVKVASGQGRRGVELRITPAAPAVSVETPMNATASR